MNAQAAGKNVIYRDLVAELVRAHPLLFRGQAPRTRSEVCPGWYGLVDRLCSAIERVIADERIEFDVFQIKAKFGELRFYHGHDNSECEQIVVLIREAQIESRATCMDCAGPAPYSAISLERRLCGKCAVLRAA